MKTHKQVISIYHFRLLYFRHTLTQVDMLQLIEHITVL